MKSPFAKVMAAFIGTLCIIGSADARSLVLVDIHGIVFFNGIGPPPLGDVTIGQAAHMSFQLDSTIFVDSIPGDVRAYNILPATYSLTFSGGAFVQLAPGPAFFGVVDGFPVSDGFFVSASTVSPGGVPLTQLPFHSGFNVGYVGSTLSSLDILSAVGTYNFTGLTNFGYTVWTFAPNNIVMVIDFTHMTIEAVPAPGTLLALAPLAMGIHRRRRR